MAKYILTKKAIEDLSNIWDYTYDTWSDKQADKYYRMILENCDTISKNPKLGKEYEEIVKDLKGFRAGRHIIFYRKQDMNAIQIIRILHEQMDLKNRINE